MKRTLFSICALVLSLTASAQIIKDTPKGKLIENLYRSSKSWVKKGWTGTQAGRYEGLVSKIVIGEDGCIYIYNPLSGLDSKSWLKLERQADGKYRAKLPQDIFTDDLGGDDDEEESSERTISLTRLVSSDDGKNYEPIGANNYVDFTVEGRTLKMSGMGQKAKIWGASFNNKWERNYGGDWALTIEPLKEQLITPPATATKSQYTVTSKSDPSPRIVEVMTNNNDIYVKGLFKTEKLANTWVKLTKQGDKAVMSTNQYLGITKKTDFKKYDSDKSEYHTFAAAFESETKAAENLEFSIDATGKLTASKTLRTSLGRASNDNITGEDYVESYEGLTLTPYVQKEVGAPATPEYFYLTSTPNYDNTSNEIKLAFYVKNADVNGNVLDPEKMYYNVYVNGSTEPFKFKKSASQYNYMHEEEMTNIPFNYQDKRNYDFKVVDNLRILHFYDSSITSLKVVMVYEDGGKKYSSEPLSTAITTGIESANFNKTTTEKYYTVDGRQIQKLQKGLNIIKSSDGTTRKVVVK